MKYSLTPRTGDAWECDHLRQVSRNVDTGEWHHVDGGMIGSACTSGPYRVDMTLDGQHFLQNHWIDPNAI